jgi:hypothetical protein
MSFVHDDLLGLPIWPQIEQNVRNSGVNGRKTTGTGSDVSLASVALNEPFDEDAE